MFGSQEKTQVKKRHGMVYVGYRWFLTRIVIQRVGEVNFGTRVKHVIERRINKVKR